jgi:hypothetical protein
MSCRHFACLLLLLPLSTALVHAQGWRSASRAPAGLAPDPATTPEAVVQVYAARAYGWRGYFGVHTWVAVKPTGAGAFTVYELMGFQTRRSGNGVRVSQRAADGYWYGNRPWVLDDLRGPGVDDVIRRIQGAVESYPYAANYRVWPGPNSNTFTVHLLRAAPELSVDLPANAIGKDYLGLRLLAPTPSGTGGQLSLFGLAGVLVGWDEGIEINLLGLTFGIDPADLTLKLPLLGNLRAGGPVRPRRLEPPRETTAG